MAHAVPDRLVGFGLIGVAYTLVGGAVAVGLGLPPASVWPLILASAALHVAYNLLLLTSFQLGEFSQVYPVARGTAPWLVVVIEVAVLGRTLPLWQLVGVLVMSAGLISLALEGGRFSRAQLPALGAAVATGACIAAYTVVDAQAVATAAVPVYAAWMFLLQGPVVPVIALMARGRGLLTGTSRSTMTRGLAGGLVSLLAYGLVLYAQTSGATAAVAALRESSIVFGAIIGTVVLKERFGLSRIAAAIIVTVGIVLITL
ncbi:EamA family transporter [Pseudonocardia xinjiangensis]|uniref:EamA family transporter n=2 Tax=Pseudonocardia xinjiangensis TaxID=75289 RepID=A0ABX1RAH2_9PSEU|nr:EamA family transporter [Pseudonocardia xinjiangensis]